LPPAANFLKKIKEKPLKSAFQKAIDDIIQDPYSGEPKSGDLSGIYCFDVFYNKTNYEITHTIFEENDKRLLSSLQALASTRENFYKQFKRYEKGFKE